jgi:hypothetical protein
MAESGIFLMYTVLPCLPLDITQEGPHGIKPVDSENAAFILVLLSLGWSFSLTSNGLGMVTLSTHPQVRQAHLSTTRAASLKDIQETLSITQQCHDFLA